LPKKKEEIKKGGAGGRSSCIGMECFSGHAERRGGGKKGGEFVKKVIVHGSNADCTLPERKKPIQPEKKKKKREEEN